MASIFTVFIALIASNYFFSNFYYFLTEFIITVFFLLLLYYLDYHLNIRFELKHYFYIILILFAGVLFSPVYYIYYSYDKLLHFVIPILWCMVVFYLVNKLKIPFGVKLLFTFSIVIMSLVFLEVIEYSLDTLLDQTFQGVYLTADFRTFQRIELILSKIDDTMIDLIAGIAGSLLFVAAKTGIFYYRKFKIIKP